jgi:hypothetical protein
MSAAGRGGIWSRLPVLGRAVVIGIVVGLIVANVWPLLLLKLGMPVAAGAEALFLTAYVWWVSGRGPPSSCCFGSRLFPAQAFHHGYDFLLPDQRE